MKTFKFSHLGGAEKLPPIEAQEIVDAIETCQTPIDRGYGTDLRNEMLDKLKKQGWSDKVQVAQESRITIASQKNKIGLGIQTSGNMSRMYADLIKLQQMYLNDAIRVGVLILPTSAAARQMGDNLANSDRLEGELSIFSKVIHMPLVVLSFE